MKKLIIITFGVLIFLSSCSKLLDANPDDLLVRDDFWQSEEDVEASIIGVYNEMQGAVDKMFVWGEARASYLRFSGAKSALFNFNSHNINELNEYTSWGTFYRAINFSNTIIRFAPDVPAVDNQYTQQALNNHLGEAYYIKALMHFYMIRAFLEIPYIDVAYDNDTQDFYVELTKRAEVFNKIVEDLLTAKNLLNSTYTELYNIKGRASKDAVNATLADVYLWMGEYQKALDACNELSGYSLVSNQKWFNMFYEGNSIEESIFEIQFSEKFKDYMPTSVWTDIYLKTELEKQDNVLWPELASSSDSRVMSTAIKIGDKTDDPMRLWKWVGVRPNGIYNEDKRINRDCNWIIYRYADVLLMKAEALNNLGQAKAALAEVNKIRERADVSQFDLDEPGAQELDELILDERGRELAFEGKGWFDLVRIALRHGDLEDKTNLGNNILIDRYLQQKGEEGFFGSYLRFKVADPKGWFLPIHYNELAANPMLRQFEYYDRRKQN